MSKNNETKQNLNNLDSTVITNEIEKLKCTPDSIPLLPINGLPQIIQDIINEYYKVYGSHRDYWAGAVIGAIALAIGNGIKLNAANYINSPLLWLIFVGSSGIGKSEPFSKFLKKFIEIDKCNFERYKNDLEIYEHELRKYKALDKNEQGNTEPPKEPNVKQRIIYDSTPEKLVELHAALKNGVCIYNDEFHGFLLRLGRYNNNAELQAHMEAWNLKPYVYNRKNVKEPIRIDEPFISHYGTTQPDILQEFGKDLRDKNGCIPRYIFIFPDFFKRKKVSRISVNERIKNYWENYLSNLIVFIENLTVTKTLNLNTDAENLYYDFKDENSLIINSTQNEYLRAVYSKLEIIVLRLAIVFHGAYFINDPEIFNKNISKETMSYAIEVTEYFRKTGEKVYKHLKPDADPDKKQIIMQLTAMGHSQKKIADLIRVSQQYVSKILNN